MDREVSTMQDWVDDFEYMNGGRGTRISPYHLGQRNVDKNIRICPFCDNLWENFYVPQGCRWESYGKDSIPRIGKTEKICPKCKSKGKDNE